MKLETDRLLLRHFNIDDLEAFAPIMANEEVMRFSISGPLTKKQVAEFLHNRILAHYTKFGFGLYAVIHKEDQHLIGFVGLISQTIDHEKKTELGYRLDPKYWGKGFATEASLAVCHYAFDQLNMTELISIIDPKNIRSLKVAKEIGMTYWKSSLFHNVAVDIYRVDFRTQKI